jgi:hypothetical protein
MRAVPQATGCAPTGGIGTSMFSDPSLQRHEKGIATSEPAAAIILLRRWNTVSIGAAHNDGTLALPNRAASSIANMTSCVAV